MKKVNYHINKDNEFVINNYTSSGIFSNFLPGIAGLFGIPMWVFYVNRGQGIVSCGIENKDNPIMEFLPANRAYQLVSTQGFRTFIKIKDKKKIHFHEPFGAHSSNRMYSNEQNMYISSGELRIVERVPFIGLETEVVYFTVPNESFAGLVRIVNIKNTSKKDIDLEVLDGTPIYVPYGVNNFFLKEMRRTVEAWMLVDNINKKAPFYRLKVDPSDTSEVVFIKKGNFYVSSLINGKNNSLLPILCDPESIFGENNDFIYPINFMQDNDFKLETKDIVGNKLPSAFSFTKAKIKKQDKISICSILGHIGSKDKLNKIINNISKEKFFINKRAENKAIISNLENDIFTSSGDKKYDIYCRQTFLDNVLRGGYPITCGKDSKTFYVYSRKHGDLERDYNRFSLEAGYFSQGNGNFRDINQNRRSDIFFNPLVKESNIIHFYNLLQLDGFNPLVLHGVRFKLKDKETLNKYPKAIKELLKNSFTPGELFGRIEASNIKVNKKWNEFLKNILDKCETIYTANHAEGFWIDHWTYNLDLVEAYLSIYPDKLREILFEKKEFTFYDSSFYVKPRKEKYVLVSEGNVRQYNSITEDKEKKNLISKREVDPNTVRANNGKGNIYKTTLIVKMLSLVANKIASLDPFGVGIEMDSDKPGWCDSMNGLPGLLGSSMPEVFELKRQILFLLESFDRLKLLENSIIILPLEINDFIKKIDGIIKSSKRVSSNKRDFYYWDKVNDLKESYRISVKFGLKGSDKELKISELKNILSSFLLKVNLAIKKAYNLKKKVYATYMINTVTKYKITGKNDPSKELPFVTPLSFKQTKLPLFLEGVVRGLKVTNDINKARSIYNALKKTDIYDKKLKMYKLNESLEELSLEVGRSSVFTRGWLENESIWLHMEYKYLLEILKKGLYKEFFEEFKNILVPFQKPEVYERSIFENSSFIVSSAFPDKKLHGKGFVARLSGSTAEMVNIWISMNVGLNPFFIDKSGDLNLKFDPILPAWLFTKTKQGNFPKNSYTFKFLGKTLVTYHNPRMKSTKGKGSVNVRFMVLRYDNGRRLEVRKDTIKSPYAEDVRNRKVEKIDIYLG